ncbi:adenosyl-hopene transferase HpnH [Opitutia bacterium KCR 482]|nr:adenosyl-hopene transferase HpnH [Opitutae bacterium KCR 482]MDF3287095.1 adenosyl-hopene transferase HpnH [Opitutae bacterium KCR 482]
MAVPLSQVLTVAKYALGKTLKGEKRYPLVMMLEPLFQCNLACSGCGKIQYPKNILDMRMPKEKAWAAIEECGAPVVSIAGGEPLLHPEMPQMIEGFIERKKYVYMCTNAQILLRKIDLFKPSKYLSLGIHLDGTREMHDKNVNREGAYDTAVKGIKEAVKRGFRVTTNTTIFNNADPETVRKFFDDAMALGVEGMMISPGFPYDKAPNQDIFLERNKTIELFKKILGNPKKSWVFNHSPGFLAFLKGEQDYDCTPWGNPTYSILGWQKPCYLINDGYCETFAELMNEIDKYGLGRHGTRPECKDCMLHSGYEASAVRDIFGTWGGMFRAAKHMRNFNKKTQ